MGFRGVVLAGGRGSRLGHLTRVTNKHLLPVGQYPMVYHPIKKLVGANITEIMLISGTEHMGDFVELLGAGRDLGCSLTYRVQDKPGGIAHALALAEDFCHNHMSVVLLGDNIFKDKLKLPILKNEAMIFLNEVAEPQRFGVAEVDSYNGTIISIEEKPEKPKSNLAVAGVYIYPPDVFDIIKTLEPSVRSELEITDVNNRYRELDRLNFWYLDGYWTDAGTYESLLEANKLVAKEPPSY